MPFPELEESVLTLEHYELIPLRATAPEHVVDGLVDGDREIRRATRQVNVQGTLFLVDEDPSEPGGHPSNLGKKIVGVDRGGLPTVLARAGRAVLSYHRDGKQ